MTAILGFILSLSLLSIAFYCLYRRFKSTFPLALLIAVFATKAISLASLGWLYMSYYKGGDTLAYYADAEILRNLAREDVTSFVHFILSDELPQDKRQSLHFDDTSPRALFFTKITSLVTIFAGGNYWVLSGWFALFNLLCFLLLAEQLSKVFRYAKFMVIISLFFIPEMTFWTSGLLKESLSTGLIALVLWAATGMIKGQSGLFWRVILLILSVWLLWKLKYFIVVVGLPILLSAMLVVWLGRRFDLRNRTIFTAWIGIMFFFLLLATLSYETVGLNNLPRIVSESYHEYKLKSSTGGYLELGEMNPDFISLLKSAPAALLGAWFRPWIGDSSSIIHFPLVVQNILLTLLFLTALVRIVKKLRKLDVFYWSAWSYCIILGMFTALSVPNFGTLSRFRTGWLFIFAFLILQSNPYVRKISRHITKNKEKWKNR